MRYSLRELLIVGTVASLAVPGLLFAVVWTKWLAVAATVVVFLSALDRLWIAQGEARATAIGWVLPMLIYTGLIYVGGSDEQNPWSGKLWTTKLMSAPLQQAMKPHSGYRDINTGEVHTEMPAGAALIGGGGGGFGGGGSVGGGGGGQGGAPQAFVSFHRFPRSENFMPTAHCLWALLFGYTGSKYAASVYRRRARRQHATPTNND